MRAVRDNELAAAASASTSLPSRWTAFALCALLGGLGGGLFAGGFTYVSPDQFAFADLIVLMTMALLGGVASPIGSAIGTGLLILIPEWLRFLKSVPGLYLAIYGPSVILIVIFMPDGIWGFFSTAPSAGARQARRARRGAAAELAPAPMAATVLEVKGLAKHFGGLKAVDAVDFRGQARRRARADRAERHRQDHDAQCRHRHLPRDRRQGRPRRARRHDCRRTSAPPPASAAPSRTSGCSAR